MKIFRYEVPVDDTWHALELSGPVVHVACRNGDNRTLHVWALEGNSPQRRMFRVFGTGQEVTAGANYLGTAIAEPLVWHLFELEDRYF